MKRFTMVVVLILFITVLVGCSSEKEGNTQAIREAEITENELELLNAMGVGRYFIFDMNLTDIEAEQIDYKVKHYEKGNLVGLITDGSNSIPNKESHRLIWTQTKIGATTEEIWRISFAGSMASQQVTLPEEMMGFSWSHNESIESLTLGEEIILAVIVGSIESSMMGLTIIYGDISRLADYDVAYVLTATFK